AGRGEGEAGARRRGAAGRGARRPGEGPGAARPDGRGDGRADRCGEVVCGDRRRGRRGLPDGGAGRSAGDAAVAAAAPGPRPARAGQGGVPHPAVPRLPPEVRATRRLVRRPARGKGGAGAGGGGEEPPGAAGGGVRADEREDGGDVSGAGRLVAQEG